MRFEGRLPKGDPAYIEFTDPDKIVAYENGYTFDSITKATLTIAYINNGISLHPRRNRQPA